jgi:hypothetical protein
LTLKLSSSGSNDYGNYPNNQKQWLVGLTSVLIKIAKSELMKYKIIFLNVFTAAIIIISCNKNKLNQPALGLLDDAALANKSGVEGLLIGAYALLDGVSMDDSGKCWQHYTGVQLDLWKPLRQRSLQRLEKMISL